MPIQTAADSISNSQGSPYGFKNRIINGAMAIDQRNAGASVTITTDNTFTLDRWSTAATASSKFSVQQSTTAATGFINSLLATSLSAYSVGSGDIFAFKHTIEGLNVADLGWGTVNAQTITVSFWVRSSLTGTFGGALQNGDQNRSYPFSFTISAANTFEYKTVTIAGDTSGTWLTNNGKGLLLWINLGTGSTGSGTAGAWAGAAYWAPTGATSVVGTNGATFYITGVQLEKGTQATAFDYRDYGNELRLCQRYYETSYASGTAVGTATNSNIIWWYAQSSGTYNNQITFYKVPKRVGATIVFYSALGTSGKITNQDTVTDVTGRLINSGTNNITIGADNVSINQWVAITYHYTASAEL